jgi:hypothetical protein
VVLGGAHGAEFDDRELLAMQADPLLPAQHRSTAAPTYRHRGDGNQRQGNQYGYARRNNIEQSPLDLLCWTLPRTRRNFGHLEAFLNARLTARCFRENCRFVPVDQHEPIGLLGHPNRWASTVRFAVGDRFPTWIALSTTRRR